ncbi:MAG: hypothetical protein DCF31_12955 [Alphaproteobacteria bacterium]|nr:MAG: hypothetical protein DCF31_12955 [Alphaproteobacteria bacterium]
MRIMALLGFTALAACGSDQKTTTVGGTTYTASKNSETATIESAKGKVSVAGGASAANTAMPAFAPQYPGSTITSRIESEREGRKSLIVAQTTSASVSEVAGFYRSALQNAGFKVDKGTVMDTGAMFSGEGADEKVSLTVAREEQITTAIVAIKQR